MKNIVMKHIFIVNPKAGKKNHLLEITEKLKEYDGKIDYEIYQTKCVRDGFEYTKTYLENHPDTVYIDTSKKYLETWFKGSVSLSSVEKGEYTLYVMARTDKYETKEVISNLFLRPYTRKATDKYEKLNLQDNELGRIPKEGEKFEVSEERYEVLTKTNRFHEVFVEKVEEVEIATKKVKTEKAVKKTTKKAK